MEAGNLRHVITLERPQEDDHSALGAATTGWIPVCTCRAAVKPIRGRELWEAQQAQSLIDHRVTIRYRAEVKRTMRVAFGARHFTILYIIDPDERHRWLQLMCREVEE